MMKTNRIRLTLIDDELPCEICPWEIRCMDRFVHEDKGEYTYVVTHKGVGRQVRETIDEINMLCEKLYVPLTEEELAEVKNNADKEERKKLAMKILPDVIKDSGIAVTPATKVSSAYMYADEILKQA